MSPGLAALLVKRLCIKAWAGAPFEIQNIATAQVNTPIALIAYRWEGHSVRRN